MQFALSFTKMVVVLFAAIFVFAGCADQQRDVVTSESEVEPTPSILEQGENFNLDTYLKELSQNPDIDSERLAIMQNLNAADKSGEPVFAAPYPPITLKPGDIILGRQGGEEPYPYGYWKHAGIITGSNSSNRVVEAVLWGVDNYRSNSRFASEYVRIAILRVNGLSSGQGTNVANKAKAQIGKLYWFDPTIKFSQNPWYFYCSGLAWWCHKMVHGKDLDYNGGTWVSPDDLFYDRDLDLLWYN